MTKPLLIAAAVVCSISLQANAATFACISSPGDGLISQYRLDQSNGALSLIEQVNAGDQVNPMAITPDGKVLFAAVANGIPQRLKLAHGEVRDARNNDLKDDPTPRIWAADLRISPDGTLLLMTERTSSSVSAFAVAPSTGGLSFLENYPVEEKQPRNIAFHPTGAGCW